MRYAEDQRKEYVRSWEQTELSRKQFSKSHSICYASFLSWTKKISAEKDILLIEKDKLIAEQQKQIDELKFQLEQLRKLVFGSKRERFILNENPNQGNLFGDSTADSAQSEASTPAKVVKKASLHDKESGGMLFHHSYQEMNNTYIQMVMMTKMIKQLERMLQKY